MKYDKLSIILAATVMGCSTSDDIDVIDEGERAEQMGDREASDQLAAQDDPQAAPGDYGVLLVDITGSMNTVRAATGNTRCVDSKDMAEGAVKEFFGTGGEGLAIWKFKSVSSSDDVQPIGTDYHYTLEGALQAVASLPSCSGMTPLADAMCKALNGDGEAFTLNPPPNKLVVLTDGLENNSNGECAGPSGNIGDEGTWQNKVFFEAAAHDITIDTRFWIAPTVLEQPESIDSLAAGPGQDDDGEIPPELEIVSDAEGVPIEKMLELTAGTNVMETSNCSGSALCAELQFFYDLAWYRGGALGVVEDNDAQYPVDDALDPPSGPNEYEPSSGPSETGCTWSCGGQAPEGCWCDDMCLQYADCCEDRFDVCEIDPGMVFFPGA